jgi:hypothetical protein
MRITVRAALLIIGIAALIIMPAAAGSAAPTRAPHLLVGTADCGSDGAFTFLVTESNSESNTWNPAFVTRTDGATGLFIPSRFDFVITFPGGAESFTATKGAGSGPIECLISAQPEPGVSLDGTVIGKIVWIG